MKHILSVVLVLLTTSPIVAAESNWAWARAMPVQGRPWFTSKGVGTVTINGGKFFADLKNDPSAKEGGDLHLEGTVSGEEITVLVTYLNTDSRRERFRGSIHREKTNSLFEYDRIILSGEWGGSFLGLTGIVPVW